MAKTRKRPPSLAEQAQLAWTRAQAVLRAQYGAPDKVAKAIGVTRQGIWKWRQVPPLQVHKVSGLTGIPTWELRPDLPDLFPKP